MKKISLLLCGIMGMTLTANAQTEATYELPAGFDAWNLNYKIPLEKLTPPANKTQAPAPRVKKNTLKNVEGEAAEATQYFVAGQTFHKNYAFNYDGGAVNTYNIGIKRDGNKVIISNLFNLEAQSTDWSKGVDYDVEGTYDEAAKTITIPASSNFENATLCGTIGTYYTAVLAAGTVSSDGKMAADDQLVFNVVGDFEALTTDQNFACINYSNDGSTVYGMQTVYRNFYAKLPSATPEIVAFNNSFDLGQTFPETEAITTWTVVNMSTEPIDYAIAVEADDNAFKAAPDASTIAAQTIDEISFSFLPPAEGDYEGIATLQYEGGEKPLEVLLTGEAIPVPDYSGIVKSGDFTFKTNIEFPFEMITLEDGTNAAQSGTKGQYGTSKLTAIFDVPEGNIGTLSWEGLFTNTGYWYQNAGGIFIDDAPDTWKKWTETSSIKDSYEFGPGHHEIRFQYEGLYYTGDPKNVMYVSDLTLNNAAAPADAVVLDTPNVNLGSMLIEKGGSASADGQIQITNKGMNALKVNKITSSDKAFTATVPTTTPALLESLTIPVMFNATEAGEYSTSFTIETTAGTVTATATATVIEKADFTSLVTEGADLVTATSTNPDAPYIVEDGKAINANSGKADDVASSSWFQVNFTVPEGKAVYMEWDAHLYGDQTDPEQYWLGDNAQIEYKHPMTSGGPTVYGTDADAGSEATMGSDDFWAPYLVCVPGEHYIKFIYNRNGDGSISEKDRFEISAIRLHMVDFVEHEVTPSVTEINFDQTYVGPNRYLTAVVTLKNTGSEPFELLDEIDAEAPFYGVVPENKIPVPFNSTVDVGVWFYPGEEGEFEGDVTFHTTSGNVTVHCTGSTKSSDGILLVGDIEDEATGWSFYDADKDGDCWNLGYNLWGENADWCHSGTNCFGSVSHTYNNGAIEPNNWLISPIIMIPEDGGYLQWYAAAHHHERYAEHYSVYIATPEAVQDPENLDLLEPVFSETLPAEAADIWQERNIDLTPYAGEDLVVLFRHHDCEGQYVLKLDDIFAFTKQKWDEMSAVKDIFSDNADIVSTEIFDINGVRHNQLVEGINIIRVTYADGNVKTSKLIRK